MRERMSPQLPYSHSEDAIFGNAVSFLEKGTKELWNNELQQHDRVKYSTINLYEGIELLLKAVLVHEHWFVVVKGRCSERDFERGEFVSVPFHEILERLKDVCGITLPQKAIEAFDRLRELRNRFVHFYCSASQADATATQLQAWNELLALVKTGVLFPHRPDRWKSLRKIEDFMLKEQQFIDDRFSSLKDALERERELFPVVMCPHCRKEALVLRHQRPTSRARDHERVPGFLRSPHCLVCDRQDVSPEALAKEWFDVFVPATSRSAAVREPGYCTECEHYAVVPFGKSGIKRDSGDHICLSCGKTWDSHRDRAHCPQCGQLGFGEMSQCKCVDDSGWMGYEEEDTYGFKEKYGGETYSEAGQEGEDYDDYDEESE